jgi:hypothetical protein
MDQDQAACMTRLRFVAKLTTAVASAAEDTVDKRARQWTEKRLTSIREALTTGTEGLVTKALLSEVADEMEEEVESYLEIRRSAVASFRSGAGTAAAIYDDSGAEDEDSKSPVKKKTRAKKDKTPPKKLAAKTNWGLKVAGESVKKRQRRKQLEVVDTSDASKLNVGENDDGNHESPPKKEKLVMMENLDQDQEEDELQELGEDASALQGARKRGTDQGDEDEEDDDDQQQEEDLKDENASPVRAAQPTKKKAKTPPEAQAGRPMLTVGRK